MAKRSISDTLSLSNSLKIPQLGFGVYQSPTDVCIQSCLTALECGYRHIDTAQYYGNEKEVGLAVKKSGLDRKDIYLTTKILSPGGSVDKSYAQCVESVNLLDSDTGYVDLFLVHSPNGGAAARKEMWQALERLYKEGKTKSIGVSNFGIKHIEELKEYAEVWPPHANQIEVSALTVEEMAVLTFHPATPLDAAERNCRILRKERHCCRGILPTRAKHQG